MDLIIDREQLSLIAEGDEAAFRYLFLSNKAIIYTYLLKVLQSGEIAEDGVQEIFLKIWKERSRLKEIANFNAYLHRMVQNHAYSCFRSMARKALPVSELQDAASSVCPEKTLAFKELDEYVHDLVQSLSPQQRSVFLLSREEGLKHEEIAQELGINVLTVKKHMSVALRILREKMVSHHIILLLLLLEL